MNRLVYGLVGEAGVGKNQVASHMVEQGFNYYSLSDSLRGILTDVQQTHDRGLMIALGNSLRERFGGDILARGAHRWVELHGYNRIVIDSIRNPEEVQFLKSEMGAYIIGITMSPEKKFQLMIARNRIGDPHTWEEYQKLLATEQGHGEKTTGQQVSQCLELADIILTNEGTIAELHLMTQELLINRGIWREGYNPNKER